MNQYEMLSRVKESSARLAVLLSHVSDASLERTVRDDGWSGRDILAHLAYWHEVAGERLALIAEGRQAEIRGIKEEEIDGLNAAAHLRDRALSAAHVRARYAAVTARVADAISQISPEQWNQSETPVPIDRWLPDFTYDHEEEHWAEIARSGETLP